MLHLFLFWFCFCFFFGVLSVVLFFLSSICCSISLTYRRLPYWVRSRIMRAIAFCIHIRIGIRVFRHHNLCGQFVYCSFWSANISENIVALVVVVDSLKRIIHIYSPVCRYSVLAFEYEIRSRIIRVAKSIQNIVAIIGAWVECVIYLRSMQLFFRFVSIHFANSQQI